MPNPPTKSDERKKEVGHTRNVISQKDYESTLAKFRERMG